MIRLLDVATFIVIALRVLALRISGGTSRKRSVGDILDVKGDFIAGLRGTKRRRSELPDC